MILIAFVLSRGDEHVYDGNTRIYPIDTPNTLDVTLLFVFPGNNLPRYVSLIDHLRADSWRSCG